MEGLAQTNAALRAHMEQLLGEYERLSANLTQARQRLRTLSGKASSTDGTVSVSVDSQGRLAGVELNPRAYQRFSPSQLAAEITRLAASAQRDVTAQAAEVMAPFLPSGLDYSALVSGELDPSTVDLPAPLADESLRDWLAR